MSLTPTANINDNNALAALVQRAGQSVTGAIGAASEKTGVNFAYLMEQAAAESGFKTDIKAKTSSATGLFQFIEKTWMNMVRDHGDKHGLGHLSQHIDKNGKVNDPSIRQEILDLRRDPQTASIMAAEFAAGNQAYLESNTKLSEEDIGATELYFAHFLGASGASKFLNAYHENPLATAAEKFPAASRANYNVFYDNKTGKARTLSQVYEFFDKKFTASKDYKGVPANTSPSVFTNTRHNASAFSREQLSHPALKELYGDPNYSWKPTSIFTTSQLVADPVQILTLAQLDLPTSTSLDSEDTDKEDRSQNESN